MSAASDAARAEYRLGMATPPPRGQNRLENARRRSASGFGWIRERMASAGLVRPLSGGLVAGVLAGVAHRLGVSAWVLRAAFLLSMLLPGPQFLLYVVLWFAMPRER